MLPNPKYSIGQIVFYPYISDKAKRIPCPDCLEFKTWEVKTPAGEVFKVQCQTCMSGFLSTGFINDYENPTVDVSRLTIGSIRIDTASSEDKVEYMCKETGIGSGNIYYESKIFTTEQEANIYGLILLEDRKQFRQRQKEELEAKKKKNIHKPRK